MITHEQANAIYDILVREAGADNRAWKREMFVSGVTSAEKTFEFRFGGALGFGGKFWNCDNKWYVTAHTEDMNYIRIGTIETTNTALADLKTVYSTKAAA